ncbi:MAG: hypothetical protein DRI86_13870 [Bacteroidetes bacterium]|nr:MAG: hypothetical protein DRI86_13870 [Bacteroidota bacterium]
MRKILSLFLAVVLFSTISYAQSYVNNDRLPNIITKAKAKTVTNSSKTVYMSEDFEGAALPTGWTETHGAATTGWEFGNALGSSYWVIPAHTNYAATNDDVCNCDMSDVLLYTSTVDLTNAPNPKLSFEYIHSTAYGGTVSILVSTNGGTSWDTIADVPGNSAWATKDVSLFAYANNATVTIGFHYNDDGQWGAGVAIDDITVVDGPTVADLVASDKGFVAEYFSQPMDQAVAFMPEGNVFNNGFALSAATNYTLTIGTYTDSKAITVPMANGADEDFTFASYTPTNGTVTFSYNADYSVDDNPADNIYTKDILFGGNELRRDNGVHAGNIGIGSAGGEMGNLFTIASQDTLTSIKFKSNGADGDQVIAIIRAFGTEPGADLGQSLTITTTGVDSTVYEADFAVPVILPAGTYFIGLIEGANNLSLEYTTTPYVDGTAWAYFGGAWNDLGAMGYKHTYNIRPQFINVSPVNDDIAMVSINIDNVTTPGNIDVTGTLRNMSNNKTLTSFDIVYSIDGGTASAVYSVSGQSLAPGTTYDFTHDVQWVASVGGQTVEVTISNPNGITDENPVDNVMSKQILVVDQLFTKNVVYEEGTGTWCGWCVRGLVGLNNMANDITDGTWIGIGVHNGDPMVVTDYDAAIGGFISGYPSGIMDRVPTAVDPGLLSLQTNYNEHKVIPTIAKIDITANTYDPTSRNWTIDVATTFGVDIPTADYRTSLIIVENDVTGSGSSWAQANYYSGGTYGDMIDADGTNYANLTNPVPAADMVYNHVGRELVDGFTGSANSVPTTITSGTANAFSYSGTLDASWNDENISFVALLLDNATGQIVNATELELDVVGINTANNTNYRIYPNPTTGTFVIEGAANSKVSVYNMIGDVIYTNDNAEEVTTIDLSSFSAGNYIVKIVNNNEVSYQKIILTK